MEKRSTALIRRKKSRKKLGMVLLKKSKKLEPGRNDRRFFLI
jgi:hypothetical protein